jgi:hypothetical protein
VACPSFGALSLAQDKLFRQLSKTAFILKEIVSRDVDPCHPNASRHDHQAQQ